MQIKNARFARRALCAATLALALPVAMAWTDKPVKMVVPELGRRREASAAHALERLGWKTRDEATTVLDCAHSLIEKGLVKA